MDIKLLEVRDRGTTIKAMAIKLGGRTPVEQRMLASAGFGQDLETQETYVLMADIDGRSFKMTSDEYEWRGSRTMKVAHGYAKENWDSIPSGGLIDVEFILGETIKPKHSEFGE